MKHKALQRLDEYFTELNSRREKCVFFYRIFSYDEEVRNFIIRYYEEARRTGVVIEGKIPNPDEKNLAYYNEMMGMEFHMDVRWMQVSLKRWLPRMTDYQCQVVAEAVYDVLIAMHREGKTENMLKNAYIKFMCWLYYKFERVTNRLGESKIPKILYEGNISNYELKLISILAHAGCDVVLLEYQGDSEYLKLDPKSEISLPYEGGQKGFPEGFHLAGIRKEMEEQQNLQRLYGPSPQIHPCTNAWLEGRGLEEILKPAQTRGAEKEFFYNAFMRIIGVPDKLTYLNELYQFQHELKTAGRKFVIVGGEIMAPSMEEINAIRRNNYKNRDQMLMDLSANIRIAEGEQLQRLMIKSFIDVLAEAEKEPGMNLNKLMNKAVYLLCWMKRYEGALFAGWKYPQISCFIHLGGCKNENEAMFLKFLSALPVDVLILMPDLNDTCCLQDKWLYEKHETESLVVSKFPRENTDIQMGTAAYHAERELDTLMYQDSGVYRNQQYSQAVSVTLQTIYEEIEILWDQELKYRPNFSITGDVVNIPVIFAKVSGVKEGKTAQYWEQIRTLVTEDTYLVTKAPFLSGTDENPVKPYVTEFYKNGRLMKETIKRHRAYQYGYLREEVQNHILDKLDLLIQQKTIEGTFQNGTEYTIVATVLNLPKEILRLIQKFDFTKKNPKLIYINTKEQMISLEDSILAAFLNLAGFDVVFFVPTGYQNVETHFQKNVLIEHQAGEYVYDLTVPDLRSSNTFQSWRKKMFRR